MSQLLTTEDLNHPGWVPPVSWFVSRVCWREVGRRLSQNPDVIEQSKKHLDSQLVSGDYSCSPVYLRRWKELLDGGLSPVLEVLNSPDDNQSQVLRSCTPMPIRRLLPPEERDVILSKVKEEMEERGVV